MNDASASPELTCGGPSEIEKQKGFFIHPSFFERVWLSGLALSIDISVVFQKTSAK